MRAARRTGSGNERSRSRNARVVRDLKDHLDRAVLSIPDDPLRRLDSPSARAHLGSQRTCCPNALRRRSRLVPWRRVRLAGQRGRRRACSIALSRSALIRGLPFDHGRQAYANPCRWAHRHHGRLLEFGGVATDPLPRGARAVTTGALGPLALRHRRLARGLLDRLPVAHPCGVPAIDSRSPVAGGVDPIAKLCQSSLSLQLPTAATPHLPKGDHADCCRSRSRRISSRMYSPELLYPRDPT